MSSGACKEDGEEIDAAEGDKIERISLKKRESTDVCDPALFVCLACFSFI